MREERPPGPAEVWDRVADALPPAPETPVKEAGRIVAGIFVVLAAGGLLGLGGFYALPRQGTGTEPQDSGLVLPAPQQAATPGAITSPVTGYQVSDLFLSFWQTHGGLDVFGYPVGPELFEAAPDSQLIRVQYFERARLEYHPEIADPAQQVEIGRLGAEVSKRGQVTTELPAALQGAPVVLGGDMPGVPPLFANFWKRFGVSVLGYPISPVMVETLEGGGKLYSQYFERARLEYHPEIAAGQEVMISNLGAQVYESKYGSK